MKVEILIKENPNLAGQRWHAPLITALGRHQQADVCTFEGIQVYTASPRITGAINPLKGHPDRN